ncbi:tail fiber domain-containing protein [Corallococcus silvisoli]|uniref:tail fiber domain-containing protein n=1 Tax=Corallococcus silvisoli TaxID=2697031 RepID=UPI001377532F|nr:tail fiber domain-containing protein [Corallococcus silvisoli]NBD11832.1 hypothetical protein [Corallococcus silvisoli]
MGKSAPKPRDYGESAAAESEASKWAAAYQNRANRPDITTPYASQHWVQDPKTGQSYMTTGFNGSMGDTSNALMKQAATNMSQPFDWGQFGAVPQLGAFGNGDAARQQAIDSAYSQATSRLDPMWQQREDATRTRLLNQGLTEGSEAYNQQMAALGQERNDAYSGAMNMAIGQGTAAGNSVFQNNLTAAQARYGSDTMARQTAIADALRARGMPMEEMASLQNFLSMPGYSSAAGYQSPQMLNAAIAYDNAKLGGWQSGAKASADLWSTIMQAGGTAASIGMMMSDERAKTNVERLDEEVLPGVPFATFEYVGEPGIRYRGVIAQDVARERPDLVAEGPDGLLRVHASLAPERLP